MDNKVTAQRIQKKMKEQNLKRVDIVNHFEEIGDPISLSAVDGWIYGRIKPKSDRLATLAKLFNTSVEYLSHESGIDSPSLDVARITQSLGLSTPSIQNLYTAQSGYLQARRMSKPGWGLICNQNDMRLIVTINALLDSDTGKNVILQLCHTLFEDNDIFLEDVDRIYQETKDYPNAYEHRWTDDEYAHQRETALERGQKVSELFLLEQVNALRNAIKQKKNADAKERSEQNAKTQK